MMLIPAMSFGQNFSSDIQFEKYGTEGEKKVTAQATLYLSPDKSVFSVQAINNDQTITFALGRMENNIDQYGDDNTTYEIIGNTGFDALTIIKYTNSMQVEGKTYDYSITIFRVNEEQTDLAYYSIFYANLK